MFKKLIQATAALSLVATPMIATTASAQTRSNTVVKHRANGTTVKRTTTVRTPARANYRQWRKGQRFDRRYAQNYREIDYRPYRGRHLYAPPRGYHWVRSGNDAVLVGITSGLIATVLSGALR